MSLKSSNKTWTYVAITLTIASVIGLAISEYIVRRFNLSKTWTSYHPSKTMLKKHLFTEDAIGRRRAPNLNTINSRGKSFKTNSQGFRDREWGAKVASVTRIAFSGDSVTEGFGIADSDRFSELVESTLLDQTGGKIDVLNYGIATSSTVDEFIHLRDYIVEAQPNYIVLQFGFNDILTNTERLPSLLNPDRPPQIEHIVETPAPLTLKGFLQKNSAYYLFLAERYQTYRLKNENNPTSALLEKVLSTNDEALLATATILDRWAELCRENQIKLLFTYFPLEVETLVKDETKAYFLSKKLNQLIAKYPEVASVDILAALRRQNQEDLFLDDVHLTEAGHQVAAKEITQFFLNRRILSE